MAEDQLGTIKPEETIVQETSGESVTGMRIVTDGARDTETVVLHPRAGASSEAEAGSGVPSAEAQHRSKREATADQERTPMADGVRPVRENSDT